MNTQQKFELLPKAYMSQLHSTFDYIFTNQFSPCITVFSPLNQLTFHDS